jgi:hypothetical protein
MACDISSRKLFQAPYSTSKSCASHKNDGKNEMASTQSWSEEWKSLGLGACLPPSAETQMTKLLFVQTGVGIDQHGTADATKAAVRAVRNAIESNSIPGVISMVPGGRKEMLIHVKLGVPALADFQTDEDENVLEHESSLSPPQGSKNPQQLLPVDFSHVAKVFPYGRLLPMEVVLGGLSFSTGRIVTELSDDNDLAICCLACVSIGYDDGTCSDGRVDGGRPAPYDTRDGY